MQRRLSPAQTEVKRWARAPEPLGRAKDEARPDAGRVSARYVPEVDAAIGAVRACALQLIRRRV